MKCPKCKTKMEKVEYDLGFGVSVDSFSCPNCMLNLTDEKKLNEAMAKLRQKTALRVKVVRIGTGIGIRFPNELVERMKLRYGQKIELIPQDNQMIIKKG